MDQGSREGIRGVPGRGKVNLSCGADHCSGGQQGRRCKAHARPGSGVFEIALPFKGDAFRVIYAVQLADEIWVVHAFQKKSTQGIKTPQREIDLVKDRLKRLKRCCDEKRKAGRDAGKW
jgi:phage-related protein